MGRKPCCDKVGLKSGPWTIEEDHKLMSFVLSHGIHCWRTVPKLAGLLRCGKSCRLRWINYLRPDLKRGGFTEAEEDQIIQLHETLGNRWSKIASHFPGRTDNEIKNHWNTRIKKRLKEVSNAETAAAAAEAAKEVSNVENRDEEGSEDVSNKLAQNDKTSELGNVNDLLSNYEIFNGRLEVIEHWLNEESVELDGQSSLLASLQGSLNDSLSEISPRQLETPYNGVHEWFDEMESFFAFSHHPNHLS